MLVPLVTKARAALAGGDAPVGWFLFLSLLPVPSVGRSEGSETDWIRASSVCKEAIVGESVKGWVG